MSRFGFPAFNLGSAAGVYAARSYLASLDEEPEVPAVGVWETRPVGTEFTDGGASGIDTGVAFTVSQAVTVSAVAFKGFTGGGQIRVGIWREDNGFVVAETAQLAMSGFTAGSYNEIALSAALTTGITYVLGVWHSLGHYWAETGKTASQLVNAPFTVPASGGRFTANSAYARPTTSGTAGYGVDLVATVDG